MSKLDLEDQLEDENAATRVLKTLWRHKSVTVIVLVALVAVILALFLRSSHARQAQLQQEMEQKDQMLARQNELIDAMKEEEEKKSNETVPVITSETLKQSLNSLQELVTQQYIYTNADKKESSQTWLWGVERPFSGKSILITYDGVIKAGVDLSQVDIDINEETFTITVTLPPSRITDNNIPQETINVVEVKNGLFNNVTFDNYNEFVSEQKLVMEQRAIDQGLLTQADQAARDAIYALFSAMPGIGSGEGEYTLVTK